MKFRFLLASLLWLSVQQASAQNIAPVTPGNLPPITASGSTAPRTLADRAADQMNVMDYGAKCDGTTDDAAAINAVFTAIRARPSAGANAGDWPIGRLGSVVFPSGKFCVIKSTLNMTNLYGSGFVVN